MELEQILARALAFAEEFDWPGASEFLTDYLEDHSDSPEMHCWLGVVEREMGREGLSYDHFKQALALQPEDPHILATAGNGIAAFDDPDAMEALKNAALMAPDVPTTRMLYGAYLAREGFHEWALEQLDAARVLDPEDPQIAYELGVARALSGDMDGAADAVADAVQTDPEDGWVRTVFGLLLLSLDREEQAVGELAEAARLSPEDIEAQILAASAAGANSMDGLAYEMLERARMRSEEPDLVLVTAVEDALDSGPEALTAMLAEDLVPNALRTRLAQRP